MKCHQARLQAPSLLLTSILVSCMAAPAADIPGAVSAGRLAASRPPLRASATQFLPPPSTPKPSTSIKPSVASSLSPPSQPPQSPAASRSASPVIQASPLAQAGPLRLQAVEVLPATGAVLDISIRRFWVASHSDSVKSTRIAVSTARSLEGPKAFRVGDPSTTIDGHAHFQQWQHTQRWPEPDTIRRYRLTQTSNPVVVGSEKEFFVTTNTDNPADNTETITARALTVGDHCHVFIDKTLLNSALQTNQLTLKAKAIADTFDTQIYPTNTRIFGNEPNPGVDGDPKVFILISPAVGNYGRSTTLGYFSQKDVFPRQNSHPILRTSNAKELISINSRVVISGTAEDYLGTIAHEFQHMINFNQKALVARNRQGDDLWVDEGMAMYAIEANGYGLEEGGMVLGNHVKRFQKDFLKYSITDWENNPDKSAYGAVYLFTVYLADRFGESIIRDIVTSSTLGMPNIEAVLAKRKTSFNALFHDWVVANLVDGAINESTESGNPHRYKRLNMVGQNGQTTLSGFALANYTSTSLNDLLLRPCSFSLINLGTNAPIPTLSTSPPPELETRAPLRFTLP